MKVAFFFLYGYGGTGKTFVWKTLSSAIRSKGEIVVNVASSGIAALLLDGGRIAHSRFAIPIDLNEDSFCSISPDSDVAAMLRKARLIIWDEAPMMHRHCFEALDRTLRDINSKAASHYANKPFGGKVILFGGDFRQFGCPQQSIDEVKKFADWILKIGDGTVGQVNNDGEGDVQFPDEVLIKSEKEHIKSMVESIYPDLNDHLEEPAYFRDKAILVPTNEEVPL